MPLLKSVKSYAGKEAAQGRQTWMHIGSEGAGPKIAAILSIFATCKRLRINLLDYLNDVLPKLLTWSVNKVGKLSPLVWKERKVASACEDSTHVNSDFACADTKEHHHESPRTIQLREAVAKSRVDVSVTLMPAKSGFRRSYNIP